MGRTQKLIADSLAKELKIPTRLARKFVQRFLDHVIDDITYSGETQLRGLGSFKIKKVKARQTHHPVTGQVIQVPEHKTVRYRTSKELERKINPKLLAAGDLQPEDIAAGQSEPGSVG